MIGFDPVILQTVSGIPDPLPHRMLLTVERTTLYLVAWSLGKRLIPALKECYKQSKRYGGDYED